MFAERDTRNITRFWEYRRRSANIALSISPYSFHGARVIASVFLRFRDDALGERLAGTMAASIGLASAEEILLRKDFEATVAYVEAAGMVGSELQT